MLLAEEPRHGYLLCDALPSLGLGRMDRPSVYRALAELEGEGLVRSWAAAPTAGSTRHVHAVTPQGEQALEAWMSIVSRERNSLEQVLQRYWYTNARRLEGMGIDARGAEADSSVAVALFSPCSSGKGRTRRVCESLPAARPLPLPTRCPVQPHDAFVLPAGREGLPHQPVDICAL